MVTVPLYNLKPESLLELKLIRLMMLPFWAHHEKRKFFGKDKNPGKNRRQEKRKTKIWDD